MSAAPDSPGHQGPWSMPTKFLPVPKGFSCSGSSTRIDLRTKTFSQLRALAAKHNSRQGIKEDPFQTILKGIPERAKLRPDSKVATTNSLGTLLPADSPYAKAWRSIKRQVKSGKGDAAAKRAEAAATASRLSKLQAKASDPATKTVQRQSQQLVVPPEQARWRSKLSAFLGRPVDVPQLTAGAPVLDMNKLFIEVMNRGGSTAASAADAWPEIAFDCQRDAELADVVQQVYQCYLHPLELDLPYGFRPARNIDHLDSRTQQRAALGCRVASYEAVVSAADKAAAAFNQAEPLVPPPAAAADVQQQQRARVPSHLVCAARLLLRDAAVCPDAVAAQLLQTGLIARLHGPSQDACIAAVRRAHSSRKHSRADVYVDDPDSVVADIKMDFTQLKAAAGSAGKAGRAAAAAGTAQQPPMAAEQKVDNKQEQEEQQQPETAAVSPPADEPAAKKARLSSGSAEDYDQGHQAAQTAAECPPIAEQQQLDAARWLLLSRRAVLSGPAGCDKPLLQLPGMTRQDSKPRESSGGTSKTGAHGGSGGGGGGSKKAFHGFTPKCGKCKTCLNPSMKKACLVNKERLAQGLAPIVPADAS